jgi:hypothetical protein
MSKKGNQDDIQSDKQVLTDDAQMDSTGSPQVDSQDPD